MTVELLDKVSEKTIEGQVDLQRIALMQMYMIWAVRSKLGIIEFSPYYLLTNYDDEGNYLPPDPQAPQLTMDEAIEHAEAKRYRLFPNPTDLYASQITSTPGEAALATERAANEVSLRTINPIIFSRRSRTIV